jgi:putative ABC transport system ATP-binding protein
MIADLDPNEGEVNLDNQSRSSLAAPAWRRLVPYVGAESGWWADQVMDHFSPARRHAARALADRLGVGDAQLNGPVARLSTGERQRLALVRAFVLDSPVLLLDEPTGPLDPASVEKVEAVLSERLAAGTTLLIVTHDPRQGDRLHATRFRMVHRRLEPEP